MKRRVADIIMDTLVENGITTCFGVVGGGAMHMDNALGLNEKIEKIFNHHEQASAMAAEAYARVTGKMAAVCVTSGPGATNTLTGVMGSWQDSLPVLLLSGQVRVATTMAEVPELKLRYRGVQEFDIINSVQNMTKYAVMVKDPLSVRRELKKAINLAMNGRRGPVWLDVPLDVQSAMVEVEELYPAEPCNEPLPCISEEEMQEILDTLRAAKRPCILAGNGIINSGNLQEFRSFMKESCVPIVAAAIAGDVCYREYPLYYGLSGTIGPRPGNFILQNADVILSLGCPLGFKTTGFAQEEFAPKAKILMVDIDDNESRKPGINVEKLYQSDMKNFFAVTKMLNCHVNVQQDWIDYCNHLKTRFSVFEGADGIQPEDRVCSYQFWKEYEKYEPITNISVLGNNTANSAKLQIGVLKKEQRIVANNNCGSMGADLPEAVGTAIAVKHPITCLTGDGSIMMNLQELQTIVQYQLPVKVVIFENDGYNAIRQTSKNFFQGKEVGCSAKSGVSFPSFEKIAYAFGFPYRKCSCNAEIGEALKWLYETDGYALLEVSQRLDDPVCPKVMSRQNADGTFLTPALHDMYPFISAEELKSLMLWKPGEKDD